MEDQLLKCLKKKQYKALYGLVENVKKLQGLLFELYNF